MRTQPASRVLVPAFLALGLVAGGCTIKATIQETTDTTSNVTGTTSSAHSWVTEDGLLKPDHKAIAFVTMNQTNLQHDMARGQGEYLASLSTLLGVPTQERLAYGAAVQARYALTQEVSQNTPAAWLMLLEATAHPYRPSAAIVPQD